MLYASQKDFERARDALLQAINTHPSYTTAHENLDDVYAKMAGLAYTRALSLDTANAVAKDKLALIDDLFPDSPASAAVTVPVAIAAVPTLVARAASDLAPAKKPTASKPALAQYRQPPSLPKSRLVALSMPFNPRRVPGRHRISRATLATMSRARVQMPR